MTTEANQQTLWKRCNSCKREIGFSTTYWACSVSTCNHKRTGLVFCSVACWEVHLPMMRHREAFAVEMRSPSRDQWLREQAAEQAADQATDQPAEHGSADQEETPASSAIRRRVAVAASEASSDSAEDELEQDILVVASKLKKYIRTRSGMNTSDGVLPLLSEHLRALCNEAIRQAGQEGRKTVMARDFPRPSDKS